MMNKIKYVKVGDYYLPNLKVQKEKNQVPIGRYGRMHLAYLKENQRAHYNALLMKNELYDYLHGIDQQAYEMHDRLVEQYKVKWGVTEELKEQNQMEWVRLMNNVNKSVEEYIIRIFNKKQ